MNNEIVTAKNTLLIAEWLYHGEFVEITKLRPQDHEYVSVEFRGLFNPITNAEQSREIEEKLLSLGWRLDRLGGNYRMILPLQATASKSLPLAIYKAALWEAKKNERI